VLAATLGWPIKAFQACISVSLQNQSAECTPPFRATNGRDFTFTPKKFKIPRKIPLIIPTKLVY
jgi:hypothetical protein